MKIFSSYLVKTTTSTPNQNTPPEILAMAAGEAAAAQGNLRHFATHQTHADTPLDDVAGQWIVATPVTVGECFALSTA